MKALQQLKSGGYKVQIHHVRNIMTNKGLELVDSRDITLMDEIYARGGKTIVIVTTPSKKVFMGVALCHPNDNYSKKEGIIQALKKVFA
jgi:hypothetical protein